MHKVAHSKAYFYETKYKEIIKLSLTLFYLLIGDHIQGNRTFILMTSLSESKRKKKKTLFCEHSKGSLVDIEKEK